MVRLCKFFISNKNTFIFTITPKICISSIMPAKANEIIGEINVNQNKTMPKIFAFFVFLTMLKKENGYIYWNCF